jgi:hypothetical protein
MLRLCDCATPVIFSRPSGTLICKTCGCPVPEKPTPKKERP